MKVLNNYTILYDGECPICRYYSKTLTKSGALNGKDVIAYQNAPDQLCPIVNMQRAVNEIALVNNDTGEVVYGVDSIFKIIGHSYPVFQPLFKFKPFLWLMRKVYAFISYNRRVILPPGKPQDANKLKPTFRLDYRIAYIVLTGLVAGLILTGYIHLLTGYILPVTITAVLLIIAGQILFQGLVISVKSPDEKWNYQGNLATVNFTGAMLLLPVLIFSAFVNIPVIFYASYLIVIYIVQLLIHVRRVKLLDVAFVINISWIFYWMAIVMIVRA